LLGKIVLSKNTRLFRFTSNKKDHNLIEDDTIKKNTYLTTFNDQLFVNTGFGAVGRYAMPIPIPASYKHDYTFPKGTPLQVGTVAPNFGQAGGGVEVKTISQVTGIICNPIATIDDY